MVIHIYFFFRDSNTRSDFVNMARFFGCMDQCDQQNMLQRIVLFAPVIALCKYCKYCRPFNNFLLQKVYSHHFIHVFHSWMREKKRGFGCLHFVERILNGRIFFQKEFFLIEVKKFTSIITFILKYVQYSKCSLSSYCNFKNQDDFGYTKY